MKTNLLTFLSIFCLVILSHSQDRQGNIVEYFGKEKINDVQEGEVLHLFKSGLMLKTESPRFNALAVKHDEVLAKAIGNDNFNVSENDLAELKGAPKDLRWNAVNVKEDGQFQEDGLRSAYLYLEYNAEKAKTIIFEASGHTMAIVNGVPHEGDYYDFGYSLIPVKLKAGTNWFLLEGGRFNRMRARLLETKAPVQITTRDMTLPDILKEEQKELKGGVRIVNASEENIKNLSLEVEIDEVKTSTKLPEISQLYVRKIPFTIPAPNNKDEKEAQMILRLKNNRGKVLDVDTVQIGVKSKYKHHKKTFISDIDGSVQYYSVAPSLTKDKAGQAMFLSVHGASVEAVNQAAAYEQKDWGHLVAPTNRRPFGFAWEDWGRLDALEVLNHAENLYKTDAQHTYLQGHSMGGHGTWYLGATYPDRFAAIAPAAGYPDLLLYRDSFTKRKKGIKSKEFAQLKDGAVSDLWKRSKTGLTTESDFALDSLIRRTGNPSRTLKLIQNYLHFGVYVLHGEVDAVVPTFIARDMRRRLGHFHTDFSYFEYPNGTHWYGNHSVDWPPLFQFFKQRHIKEPQNIDDISFTTGSPGVSEGSHFISIYQQEKAFEISKFDFIRTEDSVSILTDNVALLKIDFAEMGIGDTTAVSIDKQIIDGIKTDATQYFEKQGEKWFITTAPDASEKSPQRNGGFKDAFRHNMVFVYASRGDKEEDEWYYNRAKFDAEKFGYRANGNIALIKDTDFNPKDYRDQNVILYGNRSNNAAWRKLLKDSPVQVRNGKITVGEKTLNGDNYGAYFIVPRSDSDFASIGVVTATGEKGMHAAYANDYLVNGTTFPDLMVFDENMMKKGIDGVIGSGFFGNDWSVENGEFVWREK
ncbi:Putative esterase [Salegentibacter echinorum]|uniref:Putative esterase n=1 Tax=Salegentibacter echinorum TaxID=1073325 RepID=A0A1M5IQ15_SALEC|nr:alpha/beta hydrolase-fold protein [Salegentibacter echinorum]SHG30418.1 Putative esterase [Salegentibacter echinorum]